MSFYCTVDGMEGTIQHNDFVVYLTSTSRGSASVDLFQFGLSWLGFVFVVVGMVFLVRRRYAAGISFTLFRSPNFRFSWFARDEALTYNFHCGL